MKSAGKTFLCQNCGKELYLTPVDFMGGEVVRGWEYVYRCRVCLTYFTGANARRYCKTGDVQLRNMLGA
jgi:rRNA maturation endonuclease Nob1